VTLVGSFGGKSLINTRGTGVNGSKYTEKSTMGQRHFNDNTGGESLDSGSELTFGPGERRGSRHKRFSHNMCVRGVSIRLPHCTIVRTRDIF